MQLKKSFYKGFSDMFSTVLISSGFKKDRSKILAKEAAHGLESYTEGKGPKIGMQEVILNTLLDMGAGQAKQLINRGERLLHQEELAKRRRRPY